MIRHHGFVTGSDIGHKGHVVWKVRVKDPASPYDGQKLVVASVRGGLELARGLNVHFAIGTVDDQHGQKVPRAVDVNLESTESQTVNQVKSSGGRNGTT
jgi:hypothetical protein